MTDIIGKAFRYDGTGPPDDPKRPHHCVVVGITAKHDVLLVPICSTHKNCDRTTVIPVKDWGILTKESYSGYFEAKKRGLKGFQTAIGTGEVQLIDVPKAIFD